MDIEPARTEPALRVLALGPLEVYRDGTRMPNDAWKYVKPRELLLYLLVHPEGRTREQIGLTFWPDASAAQVKNSFHVTLHHLRKALGRGELIAFDDDRYRVNWDLGVELDAAMFETEARAAMRALRAPRAGRDADDAIARLRAAVARYRGDFLAEESAGDWHLETRDRLSRLHADALRALGERLEAAGAHAEAADVSRRALQADPLNEDAGRRLMRALARAGERGQALRQYERLVVLLRTELDAEPEPETTALYDRLRRAEPG
jgi:DNA-binding SARP family transcriptional activator